MCWNGIRGWSAAHGCSLIAAAVLLAGPMFGPGGPNRAWSQDAPEKGQKKEPTLGGASSSAGLGFYFEDTWGLGQAAVQNPGDEAVRPRVRFYFKDQMQRQFERRVWVPPRAQRRVSFPARLGGSTRAGDGSGKDQSTGAETLLLTGDEERDRELDRRESLARVVKGRVPFAMLTSLGRQREDRVTKTMGKVRERRHLPPRMGYIRDRELMRFEAAWGGLEVMTFAASAPRLDAAQQRALRRWLRDGGTLVVFAHHAENAAMREILGDAWGISRIDPVTLNTVRFREPGDGEAAATAAGTAAEGERRAGLTVEEPIEMARVIAPGYEALLTVRGWPALLRRSVGRGQIVVPTLEGRAWLDERATAAIDVLGRTIVEQVRRRPAGSEVSGVVQGEAGRRFVSQQIGYQVVSRPRVALVLGVFILLLGCGTLLWVRSGRLERLGPFGVVAAVVAMGMLLAMGQRARQQVPATRAGLQFIPAEPGAGRVPVRGMMGLFDPSGRPRTLRVRGAGSAWPPVMRGIGGRSRLSIEDLDLWEWRDLTLSPADTRWVQYDGARRLERPVELSLRFDEAGLRGEVRGPVERPFKDGLVVTRRANLGVPFQRESDEQDRARVRVGPEQVRKGDVLLAEGVITKRQRERSAVVGALLEEVRFEEPTLLAWSEGLPTGVEAEPTLTVKEQALWAIPVRPEPTEAGQPVRVPWPLVRMESLHNRSNELGLEVRPIYSRTRGWSEQTSGSSAFVGRFEVPEAVRPLGLTEAVVHLDMTAIGRPVRILAVKDGQTSVIDTIDSPDGPNTVRIPPDRLSFDGEGGLVVAFEVGDTADGGGRGAGGGEIRGSQFWTVRHFGLEVAGAKQEDE